VGETFPTGRYDRLRTHAADAFGAGVQTTTASLYMQDYFWMPNGRILRSRLDLSYAFSSTATVRDASVYGTAAGFRGKARPGDSYIADATRVSGGSGAESFFLSSGTSWSLSFAPAIEYNWNARVGVIMGVKLTTNGRNTGAPLVPVMALNLVY
jgi:hypothetical protein